MFKIIFQMNFEMNFQLKFQMNFQNDDLTKFYIPHFLFNLLHKYLDEFSKQVIESFLNPIAKKGSLCHHR